jgi:hypothetical protein
MATNTPEYLGLLTQDAPAINCWLWECQKFFQLMIKRTTLCIWWTDNKIVDTSPYQLS